MKLQIIASGLIKVAALSVGLVIYNSANAGQFGVRVVDEAGMPVAGASVCFGLPGSYRQFGANFTDADGQAMAEVPNLPFVVTVSKTRFSGVRLTEPARGYNLIKQVTLVEGQPGPRCKAGSTLAHSTESPIRIDRVDVVSAGKAIRLKPVATGEATDYRLSSTPDFNSVKWEALDDLILLPQSLADNSEVYLQLRRYEAKDRSWIEARSKAAIVFLPMRDERNL